MPVAPQADSGSSMRIACHILALLWELGNLQQITWLIGYFTLQCSCIITTSTASVDSYTICFKSIKTPNWAQLIQEDTSCHNVLTVKFDLFVCHLFLPPATDDQAI